MDQFDWLHDKFGSELLLIWLLSNALWHWVVSFIPAHFSTGTRSSRIWLKQYLRRRTPRTAIEDDQQCWAPCQRCSLSRGWSFDLRTPLSFESRPISSVFSSCFLSSSILGHQLHLVPSTLVRSKYNNNNCYTTLVHSSYKVFYWLSRPTLLCDTKWSLDWLPPLDWQMAGANADRVGAYYLWVIYFEHAS